MSGSPGVMEFGGGMFGRGSVISGSRDGGAVSGGEGVPGLFSVGSIAMEISFRIECLR